VLVPEMSVLLEIKVFYVRQHVCTFMEKSQVFLENQGVLSENPGFLSVEFSRKT